MAVPAASSAAASSTATTRIARETFSHSADYVRVFTEDPVESFAFFEQSMELSRRFRALKLWMSLQYHGRAAFRDLLAGTSRMQNCCKR